MPYVNLAGLESYHEIEGAGDPLLLLHGGFCSLETMRELGSDLASSYRVHAPERPGHGRTPDRDGPYSYAGMVTDSLAYLDAVGLDSVHVVGFSDGAIAGLMMALDHPDRVRSLVAISANLDPTGFVAEELFAAAVPAESMARVDAQYAELSPDGPAHAEAVTAKLHAMWVAEPQIPRAALAGITAPTLVMAGDHDMIAPEHTLAIAEGIAGAQLCIVPGASHMLVEERPALIGRIVREFLP